MTIDYTFTAVKAEGGLVIQGRPFFDRVVSTLGLGETFTLHLKTFKQKRSNKANRMMWSTCYDQAIEAVMSHEAYRRDEWTKMKPLIHEGLCSLYQGYVTCPVTKQQVRKFRTSEATSGEFSDYINWLAQYLAEEYGYVMILPGEVS